MNYPIINKKISIAFFDLDKTVIGVDSDWLWSKWMAKKTIKGILELIRIITLSRDYRKGSLNIEKYIKFQKFRNKSFKIKKYNKLADKFFNKIGKKYIYQDMVDIINSYRFHGIDVVLLTAQDEYIARPFKDYLNMNEVLGSKFEVKKTRLGEPVKPYCFSEGKIVWATNYAASKNVKLKDCAFYSDSSHDIPFLESVGYPYVINPDQILKERALRYGWPITILNEYINLK